MHVEGIQKSGRRTEIPRHFDGRKFNSPAPTARSWTSFARVWGQMLLSHSYPLTQMGEVAPDFSYPDRVLGGEIRATWVGHSTFLIQMAGLNILTDPIWSERASALQWLGPKRCSPPGIPFEHLPNIDLVMISHNHYDHMDKLTVSRLAEEHPHSRFLVPLRNAYWLRKWGIQSERIFELDWGEKLVMGSAEIHCVPACHDSGRTVLPDNYSLWSGWVVVDDSGSRKSSFYFMGDSAYFSGFNAIREAFAPIALAAIPIAPYLPKDFMCPVHLDPVQAVRVFQEVGAAQAVAMHFGTFKLGFDAREDAPGLLRSALAGRGITEDSFWIPTAGESRIIK